MMDMLIVALWQFNGTSFNSHDTVGTSQPCQTTPIVHFQKPNRHPSVSFKCLLVHHPLRCNQTCKSGILSTLVSDFQVERN